MTPLVPIALLSKHIGKQSAKYASHVSAPLKRIGEHIEKQSDKFIENDLLSFLANSIDDAEITVDLQNKIPQLCDTMIQGPSLLGDQLVDNRQFTQLLAENDITLTRNVFSFIGRSNQFR